MSLFLDLFCQGSHLRVPTGSSISPNEKQVYKQFPADWVEVGIYNAHTPSNILSGTCKSGPFCPCLTTCAFCVEADLLGYILYFTCRAIREYGGSRRPQPTPLCLRLAETHSFDRHSHGGGIQRCQRQISGTVVNSLVIRDTNNNS